MAPVKVGVTKMQRLAAVPCDEIAWTPAMAVGGAIAGHHVHEHLEERAALLGRHPSKVCKVVGAEEERALLLRPELAHDGMRGRMAETGVPMTASQGQEHTLERGRQVAECRCEARPFSVAQMRLRRHFGGPERRDRGWRRIERHISVPCRPSTHTLVG